MEKSFLRDLGTVLGGVLAVLILVLQPGLTPGFVHEWAVVLPGKDHSFYEPIILIAALLAAGRLAGFLLAMVISCGREKGIGNSDPGSGSAA